MDMRSRVVTALTGLGAPVYWIKWRGDSTPPETYVVFQSVSTLTNAADDNYDDREHYVYLDVYSENDPYSVANSLRAKMEAAGFYEVEARDVGQQTMSVTEMRDFHISFTFCYLEAI